MFNAPLTRRFLIALATGGSFFALASAYAFQYLGGLAPCHLCWLQRYPHFAALGLGALALMLRAPVLTRLLALTGAAAAFTTAAKTGLSSAESALSPLSAPLSGDAFPACARRTSSNAVKSAAAARSARNEASMASTSGLDNAPSEAPIRSTREARG